MKTSRPILFALLLMLATPFSGFAADYPFAPGETFKLTLHYKWGVVNADIATLDFTLNEASTEKGPCYYIKTTGSTNKFFDTFFKVRYLYESKFLQTDLSPVYFHRETYEGDYWAKNTYTWSNACRTLNAKVTKSTRPATDTTITKSDVIYDVIGMFYKIRSMNLDSLKSGGSLKLTTALDKNTYDVVVSYISTEKRKSAELGLFKADKYALTIRKHRGGVNLSNEKQFAMQDNGEGDMGPIYLWLSPDSARVPLFFQAPLAVGALNGRISSISGTKVPVSPIE